jgi:alkanesulfonate monooxygenase SsuD/methylene tetrahydromethanopterin reductase-like flavin-dependent oxidoreductase (luciferase family)
MKVGLVVMDENPAEALRIVRAADRAGVHSLWTIDYYNRSSLARVAAFAAVSGVTLVGTSVTPLFARSPLALAAAAADIQAVAGGRFVLGVGSSTRRMNQDWYGTAMQHPAPQVIERIELIRQLIDVAGVAAAGEPMADERAVFGTPDNVADQLRRYADTVDWALLYPPHYGVDAESVHANELALIEIAAGWTS